MYSFDYVISSHRVDDIIKQKFIPSERGGLHFVSGIYSYEKEQFAIRGKMELLCKKSV